jgi:hypothetical protein
MIRVSGFVPPPASRLFAVFGGSAAPRPAESASRSSSGGRADDLTVQRRCDHAGMTTPAGDLPSQRGETWNDTEAIARHRELTPSERIALAIEASRAALRFAEGARGPDDEADVRS